jgi:hypothetical protein
LLCCRFSFLNFSQEFLNVTKGLLGHYSIVTFINRNWTVIWIVLGQSRPHWIACTSTVDSYFLDAIIGHSWVKWLEATCKMMQFVESCKFTLFDFNVHFVTPLMDFLANKNHDVGFRHQWAKFEHVWLIVQDFTLNFLSSNRWKLSPTNRIPRSYKQWLS